MSIPTDINYTILCQIMNDGSGDYAWVENLIKYLKNRGVPNSNIILIYQNVFEFEENLKSHVTNKAKDILTEFESESTCKLLTVELSEEPGLTRYIFKKSKYSSLNDFKSSIAEKKTKINYFDNKVYTNSSLDSENFKNIKEIINEILLGKKNTKQIGDILCEIEKAKNIDIEDDILDTGNISFPISKISNLFKDQYLGIKIYYFDFFTKKINITDLPFLDSSINLLFLTQEFLSYDYKGINIREGGDNNGGAINCSVKYGFIQAEPIGLNESFRQYFEELRLDPCKTCVSYISTGSPLLDTVKLSKFIKILCLSDEYIQFYSKDTESNIYSILMVNNYDKIFMKSELSVLSLINLPLIILTFILLNVA